MRPEAERRLLEDLGRLRRELPFSVDVTARVLAEVRRLGPPARQTAPSRRMVLGWAAAALLGVAVLLVLAVPELAPVLSWLAGAGTAVVRTAAASPAVAARMVARAADFLSAFRGLAVVLAPAVVAAAAASLIGMAAITTYVVGRDLRRGRAEAR